MKELENKIEIAELIDEVAFDLDQKDLDSALECFSEDASMTLIDGSETLESMHGKEEIRKTLGARMEKNEIIFHNNGTRQCRIIAEDGSALSRTAAVVRLVTADLCSIITEYVMYTDKLIKVNGFWYIVERTVDIVSKTVV